jgi:molybdenum cofactor cytidylyltransferase
MEFEACLVEQAIGAILAHGVRVDGRLFKKGRVLSSADVTALRSEGVEEVMVARVEKDDIAEDEAARRIAARSADGAVRIGAAFTGRANIYATEPGVAVIDAALIDQINALHESVTIATVAPYTRATTRQMLATVKIIPFAAPRAAVEAAERLLASKPPIRLAPFRPMKAALISTALPGMKPSLLDKNRSALDERLQSLGSEIVFEERVAHDAGSVAAAIRKAKATGADPILVFGASAITDRRDVIPAGIELAGGTVLHFGMPVDPGNLLLLGSLDGVRVVGLPGCARSPKLNGFDFVLWRMAAGLPVTRTEIVAMGVGGLLTEIPTRPQPRDERPAEAPRAPKVGVIILAAGLSSRMGRNKLLEPLKGKPLVRHVAEAAAASSAAPLIVVTGNGSAQVEATLHGIESRFVHNPDYSKGLSTSLKCGLSALPDDVDAALILLGDMPMVGPHLIDTLIAAFNPGEDRAICVATRGGRRGNPVLWARRFFPEMLTIEGDTGAKHLMGAYPELVCEVEAADDAPLTDIDTPDALAAAAKAMAE